MDALASPKDNKKVAQHAVCLPVELINALQAIGLSRIHTNHSLQFLDLVVSKLLIKKLQPETYSPMGAKFLRRQFNSRYKEWLSKLIQNKIVEVDGDYSKSRRKSLGYRVHPNVVSNWADMKVVPLSKKEGFEPSESDRPYYDGLIDFLNTIEIDFIALSEIIDKTLPLKEGELDFKRFSWYRSIRLLQAGIIRATISPVNHRLNTNLTNMPSVLVKSIMQSNDLIEIDAKNSQFAILANMIKDKVNDDFVKDAIGGNLYEKVAKELGCSREKAKTIMMKTIFSKHYHRNKKKRLIAELYPESMAIIEEYKRKSTNRELAIAMQQKESKIYIKGILRRLYELGIPAFSKHDSIICHKRHEIMVNTVIMETLNALDFQLELQTSKYS